MRARGPGRTTRSSVLVGAPAAALALVGLAGCGSGGAEPQADATHEVCVGAGARDGAWAVEVVQDGEVVSVFESDGTGDEGGVGTVQFSVAVAPEKVSTVRFTDGELIGETALSPGGVAEWVVGEGCR